MSDFFIGEIRTFGFNFAPIGWAQCNGALLPLAQNQALFSLLGTTFGGDGIRTFGLPDLQGRAPLDTDNANYPPGLKSGTETVSLGLPQLAAHSHALNATTTTGTVASPKGHDLAATPASHPIYGTSPIGVTLNPASIGLTGSNIPHANMQPFLVLNFCISTTGIFPSRP